MSSAKSMANQYLLAKRQQASNSNNNANRFKGSVSNLASNSISKGPTRLQSNSPPTKSTSMSNLAAGSAPASPARMQRPESRSALDSIHNGMNAKYAQIQSKVLLQNIRPQQQPIQQAPKRDRKTTAQQVGAGKRAAAGGQTAAERGQLAGRVKQLEEQIEALEQERDSIRQELEREKLEKSEQLQQVKQELAEKLAEHERQNDDQHQKLLEAYEMADQNRRAADTVLSESRQRDEESRAKIEHLEEQLAELKEFVAMKEEMSGKLCQLREQLREERERYEEQLKSLHQVFENEKISLIRDAQISKSHLQATNGLNPSTQSGYFNRIRPALDSNESLNRIVQVQAEAGLGSSGKRITSRCKKCQSSGSKLHRSEHDLLYGSRLSTRVQDTAKSAWRSTKRLASSVISGGASISACRYRPAGSKQTRYQPNTAVVTANSTRVLADNQHQQQQEVELGQEIAEQNVHTSVIQIQPNGKAAIGNEGIETSQDSGSIIRLSQNNKLTILTKFNATDENGDSQAAANGLSSSSSSSPVISCKASEEQKNCTGSERSRCMSSSSGHGTNSESSSPTGSQNGDAEEINPKAVSEPSQQEQLQDQTHKRKSSLFKASQVIGFGKSIKSVFGKSNNQHQQSLSPPTQTLVLPPNEIICAKNLEANNNDDPDLNFRPKEKGPIAEPLSYELEENRVPNRSGEHEFKFVILDANKGTSGKIEEECNKQKVESNEDGREASSREGANDQVSSGLVSKTSEFEPIERPVCVAST